MTAAEIIAGITDVLWQMLVDDSWTDHELWQHLADLKPLVNWMEASYEELSSNRLPTNIPAITKYFSWLAGAVGANYRKAARNRDEQLKLMQIHRTMRKISDIIGPLDEQH